MTTEKVRPRRNDEFDKRYSDWHRTLPSYCYCTDLDFIEFRNGRIVAFIETKLNKDQLTDFQEEVFRQLEAISGITCYLVRYDEALTWFQVTRIRDYYVLGEFSEEEYREWLSNLGNFTEVARLEHNRATALRQSWAATAKDTAFYDGARRS